MTPLTDDIWWAAQDPRVQKLRHMSPWDHNKSTIIHNLYVEGMLLDGPVVVGGVGPTWQMNYLKEGKYEWFPALGYPQLLGAPGIIPQGPMPPWGIRVSIDAADYPKWGTAKLESSDQTVA